MVVDISKKVFISCYTTLVVTAINKKQEDSLQKTYTGTQNNGNILFFNFYLVVMIIAKLGILFSAFKKMA